MQGILSLVETLVRDLRYAVRTLRRDAALTTFAILIIGVGVGASTTVFGVVNALWLGRCHSTTRTPGLGRERIVGEPVEAGRSSRTCRRSAGAEPVAGRPRGFSPFYGVGDIRLTGTGEPERVPACPSRRTSFRCWAYVPGSDETSPPRNAGGGTKNSDPELRVLAAPPGREARSDRWVDHPRWRTHDGRRRAAAVVRLRRHVFTGASRRLCLPFPLSPEDESKGQHAGRDRPIETRGSI